MLEKLGVGVGGVVVDLKSLGLVILKHYQFLYEKLARQARLRRMRRTGTNLADRLWTHTQNLHRAARLCKNGSLRGKRLCLFFFFFVFIRMDKVYVARGAQNISIHEYYYVREKDQ